jgi:pyrroloquinoline quinone (PQQ) biosynthesis protein C
MTTKLARIVEEWKATMVEINKTYWFQKLNRGELELCHYKGFLKETYHQVKYNPQVQGFATAFFKNNPRDVIKQFFGHARSEVGHDLLALNDLVNLGVPKKIIEESAPLPMTTALNAYSFFTTMFVNPVSYLGYLFHLEYLPTTNGKQVVNTLLAMGVPENAVSFLNDHAEIDISHSKMMEDYIEKLILTEEDLQSVIRSMNDTAWIHCQMVADAMKNGEVEFSESLKKCS